MVELVLTPLLFSFLSFQALPLTHYLKVCLIVYKKNLR